MARDTLLVNPLIYQWRWKELGDRVKRRSLFFYPSLNHYLRYFYRYRKNSSVSNK